MQRIRILSLIFLFISFSKVHAWDLNDVSYLMPLATDLATSQLLKPSSEGQQGILIPQKVLERLPPLAFSQSEEELREALRVVSVRIDNCFPLPTPRSCQRQIRMVWQPYAEIRGELSSIDGALHTFYVLTDQEFRQLAQKIQAWKKQFNVQTKGLPLKTHPAWEQQGDQAESLKAFNKILLHFAGEKNFTRITSMLLRGSGNAWVFAGFEYKDKEIYILPVPRIRNNSQAFVNAAIPFDHFGGGGIQPGPVGEDTLNKVVGFSKLIGEQKDEPLILKEVGAAFRIENPKIFNPENMDCVSCHVTQPAIQWVLKEKSHLKPLQVWNKNIYQNPRYNLKNLTVEPWNTRIIRAFGYFNRDLAISQRVINESAEAADALNLSHPEPKSVVPTAVD